MICIVFFLLTGYIQASILSNQSMQVLKFRQQRKYTSLNSPKAARACPRRFHASPADGLDCIACKQSNATLQFTQQTIRHRRRTQYLNFYLGEIRNSRIQFSLKCISCAPSNQCLRIGRSFSQYLDGQWQIVRLPLCLGIMKQQSW